MKLQKQLSRKVGSTEYSKFVVTIPPKEIEKLGWKEGDEINLKVNKAQAILSNKKLEVK